MDKAADGSVVPSTVFEEDFGDILRCSYEPPPSARPRRLFSNRGGADDDDDDVEDDDGQDDDGQDELFDDILRCSYEPGYASTRPTESAGMGWNRVVRGEEEEDKERRRSIDEFLLLHGGNGEGRRAAAPRTLTDAVLPPPRSPLPRHRSGGGNDDDDDDDDDDDGDDGREDPGTFGGGLRATSRSRSRRDDSAKEKKRKKKKKKSKPKSRERRPDDFADGDDYRLRDELPEQTSMMSHVHVRQNGGSVVSSIHDIFNHPHSDLLLMHYHAKAAGAGAAPHHVDTILEGGDADGGEADGGDVDGDRHREDYVASRGGGWGGEGGGGLLAQRSDGLTPGEMAKSPGMGGGDELAKDADLSPRNRPDVSRRRDDNRGHADAVGPSSGAGDAYNDHRKRDIGESYSKGSQSRSPSKGSRSDSGSQSGSARSRRSHDKGGGAGSPSGSVRSRRRHASLMKTQEEGEEDHGGNHNDMTTLYATILARQRSQHGSSAGGSGSQNRDSGGADGANGHNDKTSARNAEDNLPLVDKLQRGGSAGGSRGRDRGNGRSGSANDTDKVSAYNTADELSAYNAGDVPPPVALVAHSKSEEHDDVSMASSITHNTIGYRDRGKEILNAGGPEERKASNGDACSREGEGRKDGLLPVAWTPERPLGKDLRRNQGGGSWREQSSSSPRSNKKTMRSSDVVTEITSASTNPSASLDVSNSNLPAGAAAMAIPPDAALGEEEGQSSADRGRGGFAGRGTGVADMNGDGGIPAAEVDNAILKDDPALPPDGMSSLPEAEPQRQQRVREIDALNKSILSAPVTESQSSMKSDEISKERGSSHVVPAAEAIDDEQNENEELPPLRRPPLWSTLLGEEPRKQVQQVVTYIVPSSMPPVPESENFRSSHNQPRSSRNDHPRTNDFVGRNESGGLPSFERDSLPRPRFKPPKRKCRSLSTSRQPGLRGAGMRNDGGGLSSSFRTAVKLLDDNPDDAPASAVVRPREDGAMSPVAESQSSSRDSSLMSPVLESQTSSRDSSVDRLHAVHETVRDALERDRSRLLPPLTKPPRRASRSLSAGRPPSVTVGGDDRRPHVAEGVPRDEDEPRPMERGGSRRLPPPTGPPKRASRSLSVRRQPGTGGNEEGARSASVQPGGPRRCHAIEETAGDDARRQPQPSKREGPPPTKPPRRGSRSLSIGRRMGLPARRPSTSNSRPPSTSSVSGSSSFSTGSGEHEEPGVGRPFDPGDDGARYGGWDVPLGVHRVICRAPGLTATTCLHRGSAPVMANRRLADDVDYREELVIPPGSYVEILETRVHGGRVRGRICWEEEESGGGGGKKMGAIKRRASKLLLMKQSSFRRKEESANQKRIVRHEGWISLEWKKSNEKDGSAVEDDVNGMGKDLEARYRSDDDEDGGAAADADSGPWTEPVPLGVYRINASIGGGGGGHGCGLPLRSSPDPDSTVLGNLDPGRCVEVVRTQVRGRDQVVRARVIVNGNGGDGGAKPAAGWISLLDTLTGSSGASPVPVGAYVVVADEPGCVVTEGGRPDSDVRGNLLPGSCMEVVATRMEGGAVRGLVAGGGHVTLFEAGAGGDAEGPTLAMPVPLGTYRVIQNALAVTRGVASSSAVVERLHLNAAVEVAETRVEEGGSSRVRGRVGNARGGAGAVAGWITLFEVRRTKMRMYAHPQQQPRG